MFFAHSICKVVELYPQGKVIEFELFIMGMPERLSKLFIERNSFLDRDL